MHNQSLFHWTLSIKSLPEVAQVANGREYPTALEKPPLTSSEKQAIIALIKQENPGLNLRFWETLLS